MGWIMGWITCFCKKSIHNNEVKQTKSIAPRLSSYDAHYSYDVYAS